MHKSSAFCGEGSFHIYKQHNNGTINIANQIVKNLNLKSENKKIFIPVEIDKIENLDFRIFASKLYTENHDHKSSRIDFFKTSSNIRYERLSKIEKQFFLDKNIDNSENMKQALKIHYKRKCKIIF